jgi:hypothetical protein
MRNTLCYGINCVRGTIRHREWLVAFGTLQPAPDHALVIEPDPVNNSARGEMLSSDLVSRLL